ncbi:uncharacterized protein LOC6541951 [Drosophila erecta]|uniref:Uncharacterized protein n=1 Tax=Drosophila erecta TaxID=7220 RepID=B3N6Y6_DROER|nr:uncharacterized protein LOC6541951 [Drosophila erecta]EDV58235.1 uncharacterized protein Dere_GG24091 [Drosophila erecta]
MAIQLDKILQDIAKEKVLHPNNGGASKQEQEEAWARIGRLNKLSVHESRSIFIVLQKKYEQEKQKGNSAWKLFSLMHQIHQEPKISIKEENDQVPMDEVEEYEMLEVQEPEDEDDAHQYGQHANSTGSASSDGESPTKSHSTGSPEKDERVYAKPNVDTPRPAIEEKKLLNTLANNTPRSSSLSAAAAVLQKKGITVKKTPSSVSGLVSKPTIGQQAPVSGQRSSSSRTTIQLPDSLKRKLSEEYTSSSAPKKPSKATSPKQAASSAAATLAPTIVPDQLPAGSNVVHTTTAQLMQVKKEREDNQTPPPGINIITIPAAQQINGGGGGPNSSTAATIASTSVASTNGFSPHIEELDFKNDIIFDPKINAASSNTPEIINLGNFDNSLPPTFFKNLCNSSRHESLGLYVANVMNRLSSRASAKLELAILRAILDVQSDELEQ